MTTTQISPLRADQTTLAVGAIVVAVLALSLGDALIKLSSASFSIWQIYVLRSLVAVPILLIVARTQVRAVRWSLERPGWAILRSVLLASMWMVYYSALPFVQLSVAAAAFYTLPLFIVLLARFFLRERVGALGWFAVVLGFGGVLVMLRPDAGAINVYAVLPVVSALLYAFAMLLTRTKCQEEDPMALSLVLNLTFITFGLIGTFAVAAVAWSQTIVSTYPFVFGGWTAMGKQEWLTILALGAIIVVGSVLTAVAYQRGRASVVSVFDYAYLAFAGLWGVVIFAERPDTVSIIGMLMIAAAGVIAARRA